jgi:hypothetical protein
VTRRRGRRRKQLLDDLGDRRGYSHLKEEALDRVKWRNRFGRGCGPVVWQITDEWMVFVAVFSVRCEPIFLFYRQRLSLPGKYMWDMWREKWRLERFFPECFGFPLADRRSVSQKYFSVCFLNDKCRVIKYTTAVIPEAFYQQENTYLPL